MSVMVCTPWDCSTTWINPRDSITPRNLDNCRKDVTCNATSLYYVTATCHACKYSLGRRWRSCRCRTSISVVHGHFAFCCCLRCSAITSFFPQAQSVRLIALDKHLLICHEYSTHKCGSKNDKCNNYCTHAQFHTISCIWRCTGKICDLVLWYFTHKYTFIFCHIHAVSMY